MVQWESGKTPPVPAPREQKLSASRVRSLSTTPVVMSAAFVGPQHTTEQKSKNQHRKLLEVKREEGRVT